MAKIQIQIEEVLRFVRFIDLETVEDTAERIEELLDKTNKESFDKYRLVENLKKAGAKILRLPDNDTSCPDEEEIEILYFEYLD